MAMCRAASTLLCLLHSANQPQYGKLSKRSCDAGNIQKTAQMQKKLKYCWYLSLVTLPRWIAAAGCCSRRGFGRNIIGGGCFRWQKAAFLFDLKRGRPPRGMVQFCFLTQCWRFSVSGPSASRECQGIDHF